MCSYAQAEKGRRWHRRTSRIRRAGVSEWYTDDLFTRREPGCAMILIQTRWHEDDLAGRVLRSEDGEGWRVLRLPAIAESSEERAAYAERMGDWGNGREGEGHSGVQAFGCSGVRD